MTKITFTDRSVKVEGHTNYGTKGNDIVCAGISSLIWGLVMALKEENNLVATHKEDGYMLVIARKPDRAFDTVRGGSRLLAEQYGKYVSVKEC